MNKPVKIVCGFCGNLNRISRNTKSPNSPFCKKCLRSVLFPPLTGSSIKKFRDEREI